MANKNGKKWQTKMAKTAKIFFLKKNENINLYDEYYFFYLSLEMNRNQNQRDEEDQQNNSWCSAENDMYNRKAYGGYRNAKEQEEAQRDLDIERALPDESEFVKMARYNKDLNKIQCRLSDLDHYRGYNEKIDSLARLVLVYYRCAADVNDVIKIDTPENINVRVLSYSQKFEAKSIRTISNTLYLYWEKEIANPDYHIRIDDHYLYSFRVQAQAAQQHDPP
jgi:hypothetical protein